MRLLFLCQSRFTFKIVQARVAQLWNVLTCTPLRKVSFISAPERVGGHVSSSQIGSISQPRFTGVLEKLPYLKRLRLAARESYPTPAVCSFRTFGNAIALEPHLRHTCFTASAAYKFLRQSPQTHFLILVFVSYSPYFLPTHHHPRNDQGIFGISDFNEYNSSSGTHFKIPLLQFI